MLGSVIGRYAWGTLTKYMWKFMSGDVSFKRVRFVHQIVGWFTAVGQQTVLTAVVTCNTQGLGA